MNCCLIKFTNTFSNPSFKGSVSAKKGLSASFRFSSSWSENSSSAKSQNEIWFPLAVSLESKPSPFLMVNSCSRSLTSSSHDFWGSFALSNEKRASLYWDSLGFLITCKVSLAFNELWLDPLELRLFAMINISVNIKPYSIIPKNPTKELKFRFFIPIILAISRFYDINYSLFFEIKA